jgi:GNAT superfamily N-acetyltransferase
MGELAIRRAYPYEREVLEKLKHRASLVSETYRDSLLAHPEAMDLPAEQIEDALVAERDGVISGFCVVVIDRDIDRDRAEIEGLFVEPQYWGQGIGGRLLMAAEIYADSKDALHLHVVAAPEGQGFYEVQGFEVIGREQTRFGPAVGMRKQIGRSPPAMSESDDPHNR